MIHLYIVRHGQDEDNKRRILNGRRDTPLTSTGREQAWHLADAMRASVYATFDAVYTSPLRRAHETAKILAESLNLPTPVVALDLIERDFGCMTGVPINEIVARCAPDILETNMVTYFLSPQGAETFPVLLARAWRYLERLLQNTPHEHILLVTHGDFGKMLYAAFYGLTWEEVLRGFHFGNADLLHLASDIPPESVHVFKNRQYNS